MNLQKENLPLSDKELELIVKALDDYYHHALLRAERYKTDIRPKKMMQALGFMQETLQYCTLIYNVRTGKLNPLIEAYETTTGSIREELAGDEGGGSST